MIAKPASPSRRAASRAGAYSGWSGGVRAEPKIETALPTWASAEKPMAELLVDALDALGVVEVGLDVDRLGFEQFLVERLRAPAVGIGMEVHLNR